MSRKCRILFSLSVVALLACCAAWFALRCADTQPTYGNRPLDVWLKAYDADLAERQNADGALAAMGTNAVPLLLKWFSAVDSPRKLKFIALLQRQKIIKIQFTRAEDRRRQARYGFQALRSDAKNVVPMLVGIYTQANWHNFESNPIFVLEALCCMRPDITEAVPLLIREATNTSPNIRRTAVSALSKIDKPPKSVIPALVNALHDTDFRVRGLAILGLQDYGPHAAEALPALSQFVEEETKASKRWLFPPDEHWKLKQDAERAIIRIEFASDPVVNKLIQDLDYQDWVDRMETARKLGAFGPAAKAAIPKLRRMLEEEEQALQQTPNSFDHQNMFQALSEALSAIDREVVPPH